MNAATEEAIYAIREQVEADFIKQKACGLSQREVAKKLGVTQSKVSMLVSGRLSAFSADALLHYLSILGCQVDIRIRKPRSRIGIFRRKGRIAVS